MPLVDDDGRLFGLVNVIDALVVVFVAAVIVAGVFFVVFGEQRSATDSDDPSHMTVVFEPQLEGLEPSVSPGDTISRVGVPQNMTVTDVFRTPGPNGTVVTIAKVSIAETTEFPQSGPTHQFETETYSINGTVRQFSNRSTLRVGQTNVRVSTAISESRLGRLRADDTLQLGNQSLGRVESVSAYPIDNSSAYRVELGLSLRTVRLGGNPMYAARPVRPSERLPLPLKDGQINGIVDAVGRLDPIGESTPTTVVVSLDSIAASRANTLAVGLNESHLGTPATITDLSSSPAIEVLATDSGELVTASHPTERDISLTLSVDARRLGGNLYFHGAPLRVGRVVTFDFGHVRVSGTVVDFEES